ncbi:MAG: serine hydrolase, partial [Polyangiales bacterium]
HDENAFMLERAGGHPGHAGAFGTAEEVARVAMRFVDLLRSPSDHATSWIPPALAEEMIAPRPAGSHLLGWDGVTRGASSSGTRFGPRSFGHLGYTGTSVWADPDAGAVAVLLTNRTYPSRDNVGIRAARPRVHDALWEIDPRP